MNGSNDFVSNINGVSNIDGNSNNDDSENIVKRVFNEKWQ